MENTTLIKTLYAQSSNHGLIRNNQIAKIGEIHSSQFIGINSELSIVQTVVFDWEENGETDTFIFNESVFFGSLLHANTSDVMIEEYRNKLKLYPDLEKFVENMIAYYVFTELGF